MDCRRFSCWQSSVYVCMSTVFLFFLLFCFRLDMQWHVVCLLDGMMQRYRFVFVCSCATVIDWTLRLIFFLATFTGQNKSTNQSMDGRCFCWRGRWFVDRRTTGYFDFVSSSSLCSFSFVYRIHCIFFFFFFFLLVFALEMTQTQSVCVCVCGTVFEIIFCCYHICKRKSTKQTWQLVLRRRAQEMPGVAFISVDCHVWFQIVICHCSSQPEGRRVGNYAQRNSLDLSNVIKLCPRLWSCQ